MPYGLPRAVWPATRPESVATLRGRHAMRVTVFDPHTGDYFATDVARESVANVTNNYRAGGLVVTSVSARMA